jgi:hypothetical protein
LFYSSGNTDAKDVGIIMQNITLGRSTVVHASSSGNIAACGAGLGINRQSTAHKTNVAITCRSKACQLHAKLSTAVEVTPEKTYPNSDNIFFMAQNAATESARRYWARKSGRLDVLMSALMS